jgi:hypothetical protein
MKLWAEGNDLGFALLAELMRHQLEYAVARLHYSTPLNLEN